MCHAVDDVDIDDVSCIKICSLAAFKKVIFVLIIFHLLCFTGDRLSACWWLDG